VDNLNSRPPHDATERTDPSLKRVSRTSPFDTSAAEVVGAFEESDALERTVHHPAGDRSGLDLLWLRVAEWTVHGWDLARAIGGDEQLDPELVDALRVHLEDHGTGLESGGYYEAPLPAGKETPAQTRMLLIAGRNP
jgi:uncharacterized protein (TIGR03086 family)